MLCCTLFVCTGYFYLESSITDTENEVKQVPYYSVPQNAGITVEIGEDTTFIYLSFEDERVIVVSEGEQSDFVRYGYTVDFSLSTDFEMLSGLVDRLGGIDIEKDGETYCYMGTQVANLLDFSSEFKRDKITVLESLLARIGQVGLTVDDLLYIISRSETNLTLPDCYFWAEYLKDMSKNAVFIS